jgi:hypothetical protein
MTDRSTDALPVDRDRPGDLYICTWLYADSDDEQSTHHQLRGLSSSDQFQAIYWRCVSAFFATSFRQQPTARHVLFTNVTSLPVVENVSIASLLDSLNVEVVRLPLTFITPPNYYHWWRDQFYVFDILRYLSERLSLSDSAVVLDSDCVWISHVAPMWKAIRRDGVLTYVVTYDPHWKNNGLSRVDMSTVASALLEAEVQHPLVYCGGELQAATGAELRQLVPEVLTVWKQLMDRHSRKEPVFREEGQTLSYIYYKLGYPLGNGDPFIRRILTDSLGFANNSTSHDHGLVVWHVPLEKRLGIRRLFTSITDEASPFWSLQPGTELRRYLGSSLGVPRNSIKKLARDLVRRSADKVQKR